MTHSSRYILNIKQKRTDETKHFISRLSPMHIQRVLMVDLHIFAIISLDALCVTLRQCVVTPAFKPSPFIRLIYYLNIRSM